VNRPGNIVCVIGMMRSGTSLVARIVNLLGVSLGPPGTLLKPNNANPAGFWEHRHIIKLNDELLRRFGASWFNPTELPPGWEADATLDDLRERAQTLIDTGLSAGADWGWKDPRTSLTLPFWQALIPSLHCIICIRNPVDAAQSLAKLPWALRRLREPFEEGLDLWLAYTRRSLQYTARRSRLLVFYQDLLAQPQHEIQRIAGFLGRTSALELPEIRSQLENWVQPSLQHHRSDPVTEHEAGRFYAALKSETENEF
jgi:hypothetical protein